VVSVSGPGELTAALRGCQVVCSLLPPLDQPASTLGHHTRAPARRRRARLLSWLAEALAAHRRPRLVQRSTAALYADGGAAWVTENWPLAPVQATRLAHETELMARGHAARGGPAVVLRLGRPYGPAEPQTRQMAALAQRGWLPLTGPADAYVPMVHVADASAAVVAAITAPPGTYNVADADPLTTAQVNTIFASAAGHGELSPLWPAARTADRELATRSCRLDARAFREAAGWRPSAAPSALPGLAAAAWAATGAPDDQVRLLPWAAHPGTANPEL
jgi:nucleoside-diphosphate-sugar epimerase